MYCKQCGAEINDGANFCGVCGTPTVVVLNESTKDDAVYVEALPNEVGGCTDEIAALQESMHEGIVSLLLAVIVSIIYGALFYSAFMARNGYSFAEQAVPMILMTIGPWKLIIAVYKTGFRPPLIIAGGFFGIVLTAFEVLCIVMLPVLVIMASMYLGGAIHDIFAFFPGLTFTFFLEVWPVISLINIIFKAIRIHKMQA